jgi:hypothetical protein
VVEKTLVANGLSMLRFFLKKNTIFVAEIFSGGFSIRPSTVAKDLKFSTMKSPIEQMAEVFLSNVFKKEIDHKIDQGFEGFLTKI